MKPMIIDVKKWLVENNVVITNEKIVGKYWQFSIEDANFSIPIAEDAGQYVEGIIKQIKLILEK